MRTTASHTSKVFRKNGATFNLYERLIPNRLFYSEHPMGWVKYFSHCGDPRVNEGGFGGAPFGVILADGTQKVLRGPWSSRAECVNTAVRQNPERTVVDVTVRGRWAIGTAIKTSALLALMKHFKFPYYFIQPITGLREQEPPTVSISGELFVKESGKIFNDFRPHIQGINILYQPE
jgi:hypothetical protein